MITFKRGMCYLLFTHIEKADRLLKSNTKYYDISRGSGANKIRLDEFRIGAFKLAISSQVPIIPLTFVDNSKNTLKIT